MPKKTIYLQQYDSASTASRMSDFVGHATMSNSLNKAEIRVASAESYSKRHGLPNCAIVPAIRCAARRPARSRASPGTGKLRARSFANAPLPPATYRADLGSRSASAGRAEPPASRSTADGTSCLSPVPHIRPVAAREPGRSGAAAPTTQGARS